MNYEGRFIQTVNMKGCRYEVFRCFHTYRRCPQCHKDMVTDGRGKFFCDHCRHKDTQDVSRIKRVFGYQGKSSGWRGFIFGKAETPDAIEHS